MADYFENLLPKEGNADYYRRIKLPISLKTIERKLHNQDFANLSELEGYFKRMVMNAKDFYNRNSDVYEDAERVRKALSNYMTKTNPAYKTVQGYSCQPAPLPDSPAELVEEEETGNNSLDAEGEDEDAEGDEDEANGAEEGGDDDEEDRNPKKIILKRKGPGRPPRNESTPVRKAERGSKGKADHDFEGVPYAGLSFQQAQEKIVEELIRKPDGAQVLPLPSFKIKRANLEQRSVFPRLHQPPRARIQGILCRHHQSPVHQGTPEAGQGHTRPCTSDWGERLQELDCL